MLPFDPTRSVRLKHNQISWHRFPEESFFVKTSVYSVLKVHFKTVRSLHRTLAYDIKKKKKSGCQICQEGNYVSQTIASIS
jgi:hypothetical protein